MIDPFKAPGDDQLREMSGAKPSASDSVLVKGNRGGIGGGARKVLEDRKAAEAEPEPLDMESAEPEAETPMDVEALLSFGAWSKPDTCFHEEAEVTVHLSLPKGKEHLTRIEAELHAEMESGLKPISKGEGYAQPDGTAVIILPVYQPDDYQGGIVKYALSFRHKIAKVLSPDDLIRMVSKTALKSADHALIPGIAFSKDTSFIGPKAATGLKLLETKFQEWEKKYPKKTRIVVYGHANPDEKNPKALSERRAQSAFAFITNDADAWEKLYSIEKWGLVVFQGLLQELGHFASKPDGVDGPRTQTAFKAFQKGAGLPETGKEDAATRKALFSAYMKGKHDIQIDASRFRKVAGNPWMGCGHNNRAKADNSPAPENRRVAFILSNESKFFPPNFPCQDGNDSPCQRQCKREGKRSMTGVHCLFYDELVREEKQQEAESDEASTAGTTTQEMTEDFAIFAATIYGESASQSETAWRSIANVIMNRLGKREWKAYATPSALIKSGGFDANTEQNAPYVKCYKYLRANREGSEKRIDRLVTLLTPIYQKQEADFTGNCVLYYSPNMQAKMHKVKPKLYKEKPGWNFDVLEEVEINGLLTTDDFKFYRYK